MCTAMGQMSGVVVVLDPAKTNCKDACAALIPVLQPGVAEPGWEVKSESPDGRQILVDPESTEFFAMLTWTSKPGRLAWMKLTFDTNALYDDERSTLAMLQSYLWTALTKLAAPFGYLTNYDYQLADDWIENHVLDALSLRRYSELADSSYYLLLLSNAVREAIPPSPLWTVLKESPAGSLLLRT